MIKKILSLFLSLALIPSYSFSATYNSNNGLSAIVKLDITNVWARTALAPNENSAIYMTIKNNDIKEYEIISVSAPLTANRVELHDSYVDDQKISRMRAVDKIVIPAESTIELKPGGTHIMLMALKQELKSGDKFTIKLKIKDIGLKEVPVEVK